MTSVGNHCDSTVARSHQHAIGARKKGGCALEAKALLVATRRAHTDVKLRG